MGRVTTAFFCSIYGLTAIAGLMLAFAEGPSSPALATAPLAIIAAVVTERTQRFRLPLLWANVLGLAVFLIAAYEMFHNTLEGRLLAGAHLLVYLTWIVLFQKKRLAQYWWMCALSVLQVAVGAILTISSSYGGMLIAFMFASIGTLSLLSLYQAYLQYGESARADESEGPFSAPGIGRSMKRKRRPSEMHRMFLVPSTARGTIQLDPDERWLGARLLFSMVGISTAALVIAACFFLFIPRLWAGRSEWGSGESKKFAAVAMTGFTTDVRLGDFVPLLANSKRVLQVSLFDPLGRPLDVNQYCASLGYAEPLFRGATMHTYVNGTWTGAGHEATSLPVPSRPFHSAQLVRQQILMEAMGTPLLFGIYPVLGVRLPGVAEPAEKHPITLQIFRPDAVASDKALSYEAFSPPAFGGTDVEIPWQVDTGIEAEFLQWYLELPAEPKLQRLTELARKVVDSDSRKSPLENRQTHARRSIDVLCRYLRDSGTYRYSLDATTQDPNIDPVEDFLFNRKAGHCEYFASALTLMLRAVGIPARMVSGFKGGSINAISGAFEVEQRHAHVWVEAFVQSATSEWEGAWITVDPTPAAREASVESFASRLGTAHELASVVTSTWSRLINIDISQQQSAFYVPVVNAIRDWWNAPDRPLLAKVWQGVVDFLTDPTQWLTPKGLLIAGITWLLLAGMVLLFRMRSRIWRAIKRRMRRQKTGRQLEVAFYRRFEKLCAHLGMSRRQEQTQQEFAGNVGPRIRQVLVDADGLPELPPRLVQFFYRVRFGGEELAPAVIESLETDLTALERAIRHPVRR